MAANIREEKVISVHHWNDTLFSFTTTRDPGFRFENGQFIMIGLEVEGKPLMRAYSIASANYEEHMEFFSIKVADGPLTSPLLVDNVKPGKHLYLLATGTGLAPFLSVIKDPEVYEIFDKVIVTHGVREVSELAYQQIINELPNNEFFGEMVQGKLLYYPTVTREAFQTRGRLTDALTSGELSKNLGLPEISVEDDRFMLCGSPSMLKDFCVILDDMGFRETIRSDIGEYVIERAFVER
jgi:ferredoxin--NADP+ reductase